MQVGGSPQWKAGQAVNEPTFAMIIMGNVGMSDVFPPTFPAGGEREPARRREGPRCSDRQNTTPSGDRRKIWLSLDVELS